MNELDKHFIINSFSKNMYRYKMLDSITLSASIESTNGITDLSPASFICKFVIFLQYIMTIIITGFFLS